MKKITLLLILIHFVSNIFSQNATLEQTTEYLKNQIEGMCSQFGSKFTVKTNGCILEAYETMLNSDNITDTVNYYHIDLANIPDTIYYSKKEILGITTISIKAPGMYMITYFDIKSLDEKFNKRTDNLVTLPFRTKNIDRIKVVNNIDKVLQYAKNLCKPNFNN